MKRTIMSFLFLMAYSYAFTQIVNYKKVVTYIQNEKFGNWIIDQKLLYSDDGKIEKQEFYDVNGDIYVVKETSYSSGRKNVFKRFGLDGLEYTLEYFYDNDGNIQKTIKRDKFGSELENTVHFQKKDKSSRLVELRKDIYDKNSTLIDTDLIKYEYNQSGDLIKKTEIYKTGTVTYEYNNNVLKSETWTNPYSTNINTFNSYGDLIRSISNGNLKFAYKYDYDSRGNWTVKYVMLSDGNYVASEKREITYF